MWIDGDIIDVGKGSVLRLSPEAERTMRNTGPNGLSYVVIQYPAASQINGTITDGAAVEQALDWPA